MTPSLIRGRPRRADPYISARVAHALLGAVVAVLWLALPGMTTAPGVPTATAPAAASPSAAARQEETEESTTADLVLPLLALGAAVVLGAYGYARRVRRARTRTTPGGLPAGPAPGPSLADADERARAALVAADDWVRTSRAELDFAAARADAEAVAPFERTVRAAEAELAAAFRMRRRYDEGVPAEKSARRQTLAGIEGRCAEAGRLLDGQAAAFDRLRDLERGIGGALETAESRFRELAGRTGAAEAALRDVARWCPPAASASVVGYVEQAKDRLVFATTRLNQARQCADRDETGRAVAHLRAAEEAVAQAGTFVTAAEQLADRLPRAAALVPAALTGAEAELAAARARAADPDVPAGELRARIRHADAVLSVVRDGLTSGPYDPLDLLNRIVRVTAPVGAGRAGVLSAAGALVAGGAVATAEAFVGTHRGVVGAEARTGLAAARALREDDPVAAESLARQARLLAEQDVRAHGHPDAAPGTGVGGALLGGILLGTDPDTAPSASFGGPRTRDRRAPEPP
ncbi:hypothetical protein SUDANB105_02650 [Streptomyces sp. enrichment culture]|uniref:hypothetical protein n=1 Tax=Streptomyces sp. enrichment culture TaxID=1795815 RepID=UPI003F5707D3